MNFHTLKIACFSLVPCLLFLPTEVWAATKTWNSTTSTNWFTAGNWTGGVPGSSDTAVINLGASGPIVNATGAVANTVEVGTTATGGTLGVQSGGGLSDTTGYLGFNSGSTGTATVSGSGSSWSNSSGLRVGNNGNGTLTVQSGGMVSDASGYIGYASTSTGSATVTGSGSSWANSTNLYVGNNGNGTLAIESGGAVSDVTGFIGAVTGSTGSATVTGSGSSWSNSGSVDVGYNGNGTLNVESGATLSSVGGSIGANAGSNGTATITGSGSNWTSTNTLYVGSSGTGSLNIESGGSMSDTGVYIGSSAGSMGTATVSGAGSSWTNSAGVVVGRSGNGTLNIETGATVTDTSSNIGNLTGSTGTATVTGIGSRWVSSLNLQVGSNGNGTLNIQNGGLVSDENGLIANVAGSTGQATVTGSGSTWTNSANLSVGASSNGTMNVNSGATVSNVVGFIGNGANGNGDATIDGTGSVWNNSEYLLVGSAGIGALNITNSGTVNSAGVTGTGYPGLELIGGVIGNTQGGTGTASVSGTGSAWNISGGLLVGGGNDGNVGEGDLNIRDSGAVNDTSAYVGHNEGSTGSATVSGNGTAWNNSGDLYVGENGGTGTLTISNGATVNTGSGALYNNNGTMETSTSTVYIADTPGSVGTLNIGAPAGQAPAAPGTLTANTLAFGQGNGTLVFNHTSQNYVFAPTITGNGTIDVLSGTTILSSGFNDFTGNIYMAPNAALTTTDSQEASTEKLGSDMRALAIESRSTANALLGLTRPVDDRNYLFYGAMFGSAVVYGGGQHSADGVTVLGGIAQGTQEYPGIRADAAPTVAGAVRYTFDDPFRDEGNALRPYAEIGGWTAPSTGLTITRIYANGSGLAMGEGDTDAISWAEYGRGGLIWDATKDDRFTGYVELGQQYINFNGYTENSGADNPFPATIGAGLFRMDVVRAGGSWTRDLEDLTGVPWSITLAGDAARSFDVHSGLTAAVDGVGGMNASNEGDTWGEFGAKLETRITENASFYADLSGTTGGSGVGTVLHAGAGLSYSF